MPITSRLALLVLLVGRRRAVSVASVISTAVCRSLTSPERYGMKHASPFASLAARHVHVQQVLEVPWAEALDVARSSEEPLDEQARGDGRFISINAGECQDRLAILQRTRRQHINLIVFDEQALTSRQALPSGIWSRWARSVGEGEASKGAGGGSGD